MVDFEDRTAAEEALLHAMSKDYCVLEFKVLDNGERRIMEITDHVQELENQLND